jgi:hypothetical protein
MIITVIGLKVLMGMLLKKPVDKCEIVMIRYIK